LTSSWSPVKREALNFVWKNCGISMCKTVVIIVLAVLVMNLGEAFSEEPTLEDVVYLRNGSVIRGTIIELRPEENIRIQMRDGSILVLPFAEVERVAKEPPFASTQAPIGERKEPAVALLLSLVLPGAGQFYNGEYGKGAAMLLCATTGLVVFFVTYPEDKVWCDYAGCYIEEEGSREVAMGGLALLAATSIFSILDAPFSAVRINKELGYSLGNVPISDQASVSIGFSGSRGHTRRVSVALEWRF